MDYEKKIRDYMNSNDIDTLYKSMLNNLFPELAESDDEKVRKGILELVKQSSEILEKKNQEQMLAWLEKQYEKKVSYTTLMETGNGGINAIVTKELSTNNCDDEQKPTWSKEDEKIALSIEQVINCASLLNIVPEKVDKIRTWLKSLKDRVRPKQEWSGEDEDKMQIIINIIKDSDPDWEELIDWLKSLKERCTWRPSEEQLDALKRTQTGVIQFNVLQSLYSDLKKLSQS